MTQAQVIKSLQNGPLTSHEIANLTGMPQTTVLSTAKKLRYQGKLTTEIVKVKSHWVAKYTLADKETDSSDDGVKYICGIPTYGIFTKSEYAVMRQQATRLFGKQGKKEITNNQFI